MANFAELLGVTQRIVHVEIMLTYHTSRSRISHKDDWLQVLLTSPMLHQRGSKDKNGNTNDEPYFGYIYTQMNSNEEGTLGHNTISEKMEINKS